MGIIVAIFKAIDLTLAGAQVVDQTITKVKMWKRKRRLIKAINKKASSK